MKTLIDYILEAREYLNPGFGVEELYVLFQEFENNEEFDDDLLYGMATSCNMDTHAASAILTAYFYSPKGMGGKLSRPGCEALLELLKRQPVNRIKNILGAGGEGMVYQLGNGKVMKVMYDVNLVGDPEKALKTFKSMVGKKYKTLPNVYKVTGRCIIKDDAAPGSKSRKYYDIATNTHPEWDKLNNNLEHIVAAGKEHILDDKNLTPEEKEVRDWLIILREELVSIGVKVERNFGDFTPRNLGVTKDGRVVFFDW